jgi:hypothetical protein
LGVPLIQQYNFDLQYELARNWTVDVGYVGSHGTKLFNWSQPQNIAFLAPGAPNGPTDAQNGRMVIGSGAQGTPNSFAFNDPNNTNPSTQILANTGNSSYNGNYLGRVSYLGFGANGMASTNTFGDSLYDSLQAQLRHQFSNGLLLQVSYTWSKLITNINAAEGGAGIAAPGNVLSGSAGSNDPLDMRQQYGLAAFNRPQRLIVAYSYDLPYKNKNGFAGHVLGGWTVSGITTIQNGEPLSVIDSNGGRIYWGPGGLAFCTGCNVRAQLLPANQGKCNSLGVCSGSGVATSGSNHQRILSKLQNCTANGWMNQSAFGAVGSANLFNPCGTFTDAIPCIGGVPNTGPFGPPNPSDPCGQFPAPAFGPFPADPGYPFVGAGTGFGNSGVGIVTGPGQHNWDLSLIKNTKITEGTSLEFRAEFYNIWNHAQFNNPADNVATPATFGLISSSSVPPRIMQFALKFYF